MLWAALGLAAVTIAARAAQPGIAVAQSALSACASVAADSDRLACYDRLAGRAAPSGGAKGAAALPAEAVPAAAVAPSAAPAPLAHALPSKEAFGLYEAEHPQPARVQVAPSLEARIIALGRTADGRMSVSLEGGAVWDIDQADPLLAIGDTVTLTRAAFGSYLMHTPSGRTHRGRRVR